MDFLYYMTSVAERSGVGVKEKIRNPFTGFVSPYPSPFFIKEFNTRYFKSIVLVTHTFGGVHIHLLEF